MSKLIVLQLPDWCNYVDESVIEILNDYPKVNSIFNRYGLYITRPTRTVHLECKFGSYDLSSQYNHFWNEFKNLTTPILSTEELKAISLLIRNKIFFKKDLYEIYYKNVMYINPNRTCKDKNDREFTSIKFRGV